MTSVTTITPPSLHLSTERPRFQLIGPGYSWKHAFYECLQETWTDGHQSLYYCESVDEDYMWHFYQLPHVDYVILSASAEIDPAFYSFTGYLAGQSDVYLSITPWVNQNAIFIFTEKNPQNIIIDPKALILQLRDAY